MGIVKIDGINWDDVVKVSGIAKASVVKVGGIEGGPATATRWVTAHADRIVSHAGASARNPWNFSDSITGSKPSAAVDQFYVAYGKDAAGNGRWVQSHAADNAELSWTSDPVEASSSGDGWNPVSHISGANEAAGPEVTIPNRLYAIQWGADHWCAVGQMKSNVQSVLRSVDGNNWFTSSLSQLVTEGSVNTQASYGLTSDGAGTWWFSQQNRIFKSTNHGETWSLHHTLVNAAGGDPGDIRALTFTNNTLACYIKGGNGALYTAAASDTTDFGSASWNGAGNVNNQMRVCSANGRVFMAYSGKYWAADIDGKDITIVHDNVDITTGSHGTANSCATDGTTFVIGCDSGDIIVNENNLATDGWYIEADNVGAENIEHVAHDVTLPIG